MFKKPSKLLDECTKDNTQVVLTENEIALEYLRHTLKESNVNNSLKALAFSTENNIPLNLVLSVGEPQYSVEGFFTEIGKTIKSSLGKFADIFRTKDAPEINAVVFNALRAEIKQIIYSDNPENTCKSIISSRMDAMIAAVNKKLETFKDIDLDKKPVNAKIISDLLKKVAKSADKLNNDSKVCFSVNMNAASNDAEALRKGADDNADEATVDKSFDVITKGINVNIDDDAKTICRQIVDKYSDKNKARKVLFDAYTNSNTLKAIYERTKNLSNQNPSVSTEASKPKDTNKATGKKRAVLTRLEKENRTSWYIFWFIMFGPVGLLASYIVFKIKDSRAK